jgi:hypothetical protein
MVGCSTDKDERTPCAVGMSCTARWLVPPEFAQTVSLHHVIDCCDGVFVVAGSVGGS